MGSKMQKIFNVSLAISIVFVFIGLFLFIKPDTTISIISYIMGSLLIILGLSFVIKYFKNSSINNMFSFELSYGVLLIIAGLFLIIKTNALATIFPIILGMYIITNAVTKFQYALVLRKINSEDFGYTLLVSALIFIWGIVLLINPFKTSLAITQTIGIFIIVYAVLDIIDNFMIRKNIKRINEVLQIENK